MNVCAWCHDEIAARPSASPTGLAKGRHVHRRAAGHVSHGICPRCLDAQLAALPAARTPAPHRGLATVGFDGLSAALA
jgi:hypothetical protein